MVADEVGVVLVVWVVVDEVVGDDVADVVADEVGVVRWQSLKVPSR